MLTGFLQLILVFIFHTIFPLVYSFEPNLVQEIRNVTVAKGKEAVFTCVVHDLGGHKVAWINADTKAVLAVHDHVITNNDRLYAAQPDSNTWTLTIRNVKREDRGFYMCQVNTDPMKSWKVFLEVVIPPDITVTGSTDTTVIENRPAQLECRARGVPKPSVVWRREDGKEIVIKGYNNEKNRNYTYEGETLLFPKVTRNEMGMYLCIASNGVPPAVSQRIQLTVNFHPIIHVPNQLVGAPRRKSVILQCISEAFPKPINFWQKTTKSGVISMVVSTTEEYEISENVTNEFTFHLTLLLKKLKKKDYGTYKCLSKNSIGESEGTIRIYEMSRTLDNKALANDISNHFVDSENNEINNNDEEDDEENDDADSTLRENKTKKLVRKENSTAIKQSHTRFIFLIAMTLYIFLY